MIKVMALLIRISPAKWPLNIEKVMFILQLCRFPFASLSFLCSQCFYKFNFTIRHTKQMLRFAANIEIVNIKPELLFSTATDWEIEFQTFIIFRAFSLYQSPLGVFHSIILFSISRKKQEQNSLDNTGPGVSPAVGNANNPPGPLAEAQPLVGLQSLGSVE